MTRRLLRTILGVILAVIGILWILQGADVLGMKGGMNGRHIWILIGAIVLVAGLALIYTVNRRGLRPR